LTEIQKILDIKVRKLMVTTDLPVKDTKIIILSELFQINFVESVHERLWKSLPATNWGAGLTWILAGEDKEVWVAFKFFIELWDVDCSSMVENSIKTFKNTLLCQVHFVDKEPMAFFDSSKKNTITPSELDVFILTLIIWHKWIFTSKQVHHICLLREIDSAECSSALFGKVFNQTGFSNTWRSLNQNRLLELVSS
jgi:hypothetical protein